MDIRYLGGNKKSYISGNSLVLVCRNLQNMGGIFRLSPSPLYPQSFKGEPLECRLTKDENRKIKHKIIDLPLSNGVYKLVFDAPNFIKYKDKNGAQQKTPFVRRGALFDNKSVSYIAFNKRQMEYISSAEAHVRVLGFAPDWLKPEYREKIFETAIPFHNEVYKKKEGI